MDRCECSKRKRTWGLKDQSEAGGSLWDVRGHGLGVTFTGASHVPAVFYFLKQKTKKLKPTGQRAPKVRFWGGLPRFHGVICYAFL